MFTAKALLLAYCDTGLAADCTISRWRFMGRSATPNHRFWVADQSPAQQTWVSCAP